MCGITGYIAFGGEASAYRPLVQAMTDLQSHRGPDAQGVYVSGEAALGHRRLSIIDLSSGQQPMSSDDGRITVVFNGEIYNFPELRADLEGKGCQFRTRSDTEVLIHGYRVYGLDLLGRLNGMFAFALWDATEHRLLAARDRMGKKPLYYRTTSKGHFAFASEMKSLLCDADCPRDVSEQSVDWFFSYGYIPSPGTIFRGIEKLRPGHFLIAEKGKIEVKQYWDLQYKPKGGGDLGAFNEEACVDELEFLLTQAVKRRLLSEVPLGAFLSGGMDSSLVVAFMAKLLNQPVKTFTIAFEEAGYSEAESARTIANAFKTEHHEYTVRSDAASLLPKLVWHCDEPFADSSAIPTYLVSEAARKKVTVILSGDGGDELFAGYNDYQDAQILAKAHRVPAFMRHALRPLAFALPFEMPGKNWLMLLSKLEDYKANRIGDFFPLIKESLLSPDFLKRRSWASPGSAIDYWRNLPGEPLLSRMQYSDQKLYLPDDILVKVDRMSMACSLETRAPLLDYTLAEFAATIPAALQRKDGGGKYFLRKLAARHLPPQSLNKKKQGFAIPRDQWFRKELRQYAYDLLNSKTFLDRGYFQAKTVNKLLNAHQAGGRDYSLWIWSMVVFELWFQTYVDVSTRRV